MRSLLKLHRLSKPGAPTSCRQTPQIVQKTRDNQDLIQKLSDYNNISNKNDFLENENSKLKDDIENKFKPEVTKLDNQLQIS